MRAEIISVGTELLLGNIVNTDARDISVGLSELGIDVFWHTVVGDNPQRLRQVVAVARERADLILTTGGLGPTCDDLTKQVLAEAFGLALEFNQEAADRMREYFRQKGKVMTENNLQQAYLPAGSTVFQNDWGTAPGCAFLVEGVRCVMLPGPPRECNAMFRHCAMPYLQGLSDEKIFTHNLRVFGEGESAVEYRLRDLMNRLHNPTLAPYAKEGEMFLRLTAKAHSPEEAEALMAPVLVQVKAELGDLIYGVDVESLEEAVLRKLQREGKTLTAAESCTGGGVAKRLTALAGASEVFLGGVTVYTNAAKQTLLDIPAQVLEEKGAVSREVAVLLAQHVREKLGSDYGLGITGLAGPGGDGVHPVGTVFVGLATADSVTVRELHLTGGRNRVRLLAEHNAFDMVLKA